MSRRFFQVLIFAGLLAAVFALASLLGREDISSNFTRSTTLMAQSAESIFSGGKPPEAVKPIWKTDWSGTANIVATLLLATVLSGLIGYRRRGGVAQIELAEAHIILALSAALMMMIIGSQIARAFGLMGAASIVRYRYSLKSPKEASSLVIALGVGMACGVGLYPLAIIVSLFLVMLLNLFEHMPIEMKRALFPSDRTWILKVRGSDAESATALVKDKLVAEGVNYKVRRVAANKGPERDQAEIEIEVFGRVDRGKLAEELSKCAINKISWKQRKTENFYDTELDD